MRLLQIVPAYASYAVFLRELTEAAVNRGHPTAVVCGGVPPEIVTGNTGGVQLLPLEMPRGSNAARHWLAARPLRRLIEEWRADVVHAHFSAGIFSAALALRRGDPWFSLGTFQGLLFPLSSGRKKHVVRAAETFAARRFDRVHVLTADDLQALQRASPSVRAEVQPGYGFGCADRFVDTPRASLDQRRSVRRSLSIPDECQVLIFVGRLVAFKGFDLAVRAFWRLKAARPQVRLIVLGEGDPLHPTGLSDDEWKRYQSDPDIVRAGVQADVLPWLDLADLMLFPTEREGMPVCVMEALARNLPVVTAPVRGCRELIAEGRNGFLIASREEGAWVERLALLTEVPVRSASEDRAFRERLRRSRWVTDTLNGYAEACAARQGTSTVFSTPQQPAGLGREFTLPTIETRDRMTSRDYVSSLDES